MKERIYWVMLVAILVALPHIVSSFYVFLAGSILIYGLFALSFNLLFGYTGLLSFGQAGFFALGAYSAGLILKGISATGFAVYGAILGALFVSMIAAILIGIICVRLSGWVFAMVTLAFGQVIFGIVYKWRNVTGGDDGLYGIPVPILNLFGYKIDLKMPNNHYYYVMVVVIISVLILRMVVKSPLGNTLRSIRDNPVRAEFIGLNVWNYRLVSFVIAGSFSGLAGALFCPFKGIANPELASWSFSACPVIMSLVGGTGVFVGPLVGAVVYRLAEHFITSYTKYWMLFFGTMLVICVISFRGGVAPFLMKCGHGFVGMMRKSLHGREKRIE